MKKVILFDFDGVLVDTLNIYHTISSEVNEKMDIEEYKTFFEGNIHDAVRKDGSMRSPHPNFHERFLDHIREIKIPPILKDLLYNLSKKYKLFIISSTPTKTLNHILTVEGVKDYFAEVLGSDVNTSKVIKNKMILEKYGIKPKDALFITDTLGDIKEATKCDIESIAVTWGFHEKKTLLKEKTFALVDSPEELEQKIEEFFVV